MAHWRAASEWRYRFGIEIARPHASLVWLTATVAAPILLLLWFLPPSLVLPVFSVVSLAGAGIMALFAWYSKATRDSAGITAWDVAGAFAFIGFAAGMLSEPEHVVNLFGHTTMVR